MNTAKTIDWNSPDVLEQIIQNIRNPLENIITVSKSTALHHKEKRMKSYFQAARK
ncbi:hypothetical protein KBP46_15460 [Chryseobacterium sp. PCH239]|uniref:hypothetical protein n=1 Tax=Chryseobacterium sp. PCH239 TaxID=2825845 RepID=UPI001C126CF3|nr:hypothetical protein [Chryseobacterium sp. PCH239]QWT84879.1 hypothetical protein KBP46_15460 [Chryseobacterium sp. PCH239]